LIYIAHRRETSNALDFNHVQIVHKFAREQTGR